MHRTWMVLGVGLALVGAACSGVSQADGSGDSLDTDAYLEVVANTESEYAQQFKTILEATTRSYSTRGVLFEAVDEAGFPGGAQLALTQAQGVTPPGDFAQDHANWIQLRSTIVGIAEDDFVPALESRDLQELLAVLTKVDQSYGSFLKGLSREFCLAAAFNSDLCPAGDDLPGGEYGQQVHEVLRINRLDTSGLFTFVADMSPEERSVRLAEVQPQIESSLKSAGDAMARIDPPSAFVEEHAAFVRFFEEQYSTAVAITEANAEGDDARVLILFGESGEVLNRLRQSITPEYGPIAVPFFATGIAG
ncbi:MAG: hypothetical protein BMS9Abin20_1047 [Acidimicrobiia bacterium]|nr:MAG: hypothetical protein BMS9Abin20_1047 [Acidimicrobiia bacterium]